MPRSAEATAASRRHAALQDRAEELGSTLPPLLVAAERVAATVAQGVHGRRRVGVGESFWQFRRYEPGDPVQRIDWRQTARSQAVFVREQEWEASQTVWLWRDGSPGMDYASAGIAKRARADLLLVALASLLVRAGERVRLLGRGGPPASGRAGLARLAADLPASGRLPEPEALPRHAGLVLIGDFLSPLPAVEPVLRAFAGRDISGHLLQVLDPAEATLPFAGRVRFQGFAGERDWLVPRVETVREAYLERLQAHQDGLAALARAFGWSLAVHRTDRPASAALLALYAALGGVPAAAAP